ncbi:MAG: response regulator transcription factor [Bifidobacteriaceae bacterium]|jgi:DNA-binding response OmpR family regulator|nr:response regulator transcription factor [Bifidobacteriaceae bacterium]
MAEILLLAPDPSTAGAALPALEFLPHHVRQAPLAPSSLVDLPNTDLIMLDARRDLQSARATARLLRVTGVVVPVLLIVTEGGLTALNADWGVRDFLLSGASPGEIEARLRLALANPVTMGADPPDEAIAQGNLVINPVAYTAKLHGRTLDLTYKEFELLRYLASHPGRVFTRTQLLQEVWGYDYYGGTRTVDVHVRRLRAKLGPENDQLIGTVRNVGYRFDSPKERHRSRGSGSDGRSSEGGAAEEASDDAAHRAPA